jgi:hypothetical protein
MTKYQVGVYNRFIRDKVRAGEEVDPEQAAWEDTRYFDIEAKSEEEARKKIRLDYTESKGFVIDCVDAYKFGG